MCYEKLSRNPEIYLFFISDFAALLGHSRYSLCTVLQLHHFEITQDKCNFRLKNVNEGRTTNPVVWRYQHFDSHGEYHGTYIIGTYQWYMQKRSTLASTLSKVHAMASDDTQLSYSAGEKLQEFTRLGYPAGIRKYMCHSMAIKTGDKVWFAVGKTLV